MRTVHEVSRLTGVSIRTLQYYDEIGLLPPASHTEAGYRLYDDRALERLQQILLFRELEFPLKEIKAIVSSPDFDKVKALEQQVTLLELKKEHLEKLIRLAHTIQSTGGKNHMDFSAFDTKKLDEYAAQAKASWGHTEAYREYEKKSQGRSPEETDSIAGQMMQIFADFGAIKQESPSSEPAQALVRRLQEFITAHYYTCTNEILSGLGQMYAAGGEMTENIDHAGGTGTAAFAKEAILVYCNK